ncbi:hypothetical protein LCGC14_0340860 [marine sediment metagenome]|uniref:Uncharacterized protein n=1 Tax=marine sediment metagenome TaxID=412755 RepID=A0A0F9TJ72_9ZZZZ
MKKYEWNNPMLKKRNNIFSWLALLSMCVALLFVLFTEGEIEVVALTFVGLAMVFAVITWKVQVDDKKLKK